MIKKCEVVFIILHSCRRQKAGGRRQKAEGRRQKAGGRRQEAGGRRQKAGGKFLLFFVQENGINWVKQLKIEDFRFTP
ncbi:MAG: hypothetical protein F6K47_11045 [Symploca sp. SIO2E6]|nr:hypothetical protein [Symploca sp. SIO2E6]